MVIILGIPLTFDDNAMLLPSGEYRAEALIPGRDDIGNDFSVDKSSNQRSGFLLRYEVKIMLVTSGDHSGERLSVPVRVIWRRSWPSKSMLRISRELEASTNAILVEKHPGIVWS